MKRALLTIMILSSFLLYCSNKDDEKAAVDRQDTPESTQNEAFSLEAYLDTVSNEVEKTAAQYLKAMLLDGDYRNATEYLCRDNLDLIKNDSVVQFLFFGRTNPDWDEVQAFRFEITRKYIPVVASFNEITEMHLISCDSVCLMEYRVTGPLAIKGIFDAALGEGGRFKFDSFVDSNVTLVEKREYYDSAFARLAKIADSLDFSTRVATDTLIIIEEEDGWKVCREAQRSWDVFRAF